jgi:hypothetical protein
VDVELPVLLADQFGAGPVTLDYLNKLGVPVSKAHVPDPPAPLPDGLVHPFEHLTWYEFFEPEPQPPRLARLKNQFTSENKGALFDVGDGAFLLVPAIKDGLGVIELGQHWKCYDADLRVKLSNGRTLPDVSVNLLDQFHLEEDVVVGPGRYLCNPVEKEHGPDVYPIVLPDQHLACYDISPVVPWNQPHFLEDQFGDRPAFVENPELLCLPSLKFLPEPGALLSLGSGLLLLGWLDRRRKRRAIGP